MIAAFCCNMISPSGVLYLDRPHPYIFSAFPGLSGKVPWTPLGRFPTPVERMHKLGDMLGCPGLYVKRDDLSGEVYGGNKVRKLEFSLAHARDLQRNPVITAGALGSNHVLATTIYARHAGLDTAGVFVPQPVQEYLWTNILCNCMQGCKIHYVSSDSLALFAAARVYLMEWMKNRRRPYLLWAGGSSTLGILGYAEAAFEIARQVEQGEMPRPDYIFVPVGSAGTLAGLVLGVKLAGLDSKPVGVRVYDKTFANERLTAFMANRALRYLRGFDSGVPLAKTSPSEVFMIHDYFGPGYAHFTRRGQQAIETAREAEGIKLEGTYTGKTMAAFIDFMKRPGNRESVALFINTYNSRPLDGFLAECPGPEILPGPVQDYFNEEVAPVHEEEV